MNLEMIATGNAWFYEYHAKREKSYRKAFKKAQEERLASIFGIIYTHLFMTKGGESISKGSNDSVFGDLCQRGRKY